MDICLTASKILETLLPDIKPDAQKAYCPSIYNQYCTTNQGMYLYNALSRRLVRLTDAEKTLLQQQTVPGDAVAAKPLIAKRFLVATDTDEAVHYAQLHATQELFLSATDRGLELYRILPTTGCNARCFYCFEQGVEILNMNEDTADAVTDYIKKTHNPNKKIRLEWFGGEPLLRQSTVDQICTALNKANVAFYSTMTTNGSLITPELVEKAKEIWHLDKVQITLDGVGEVHNRRKAYIAFPDAYGRTLETIRYLVAEGIGVTVRMNMDMENAESVYALYDHLRTQYRATDRIMFDPALLFDKHSNPQLREQWVALRKKIWQDGFMKVPPLSNELPRWHCIANSSAGAMIQPDGILTTCEAGCSSMYYGNVRQGITDPKRKKLWRNCTDIREKCKTCPYLPECTGFSLCPYEAADCRRSMADTFAYRLVRTVQKYEEG